MHFSVVCHFCLTACSLEKKSLSPCSQKPLGVPQESASAHITHLYRRIFRRRRFEPCRYEAWAIRKRSHFLLMGKNCSRNSNCQADSAFVVWDACCMTFLLTHMETNVLVWKRVWAHRYLLFQDNFKSQMDTAEINYDIKIHRQYVPIQFMWIKLAEGIHLWSFSKF